MPPPHGTPFAISGGSSNAPHPSEKTPEEAARLADVDFQQDPKAFLAEIYKEAYNAGQPQDDRINKVMMKCSTVFVRMTYDQIEISKTNLAAAHEAVRLAQDSVIASRNTLEVAAKAARDAQENLRFSRYIFLISLVLVEVALWDKISYASEKAAQIFFNL